MRNLRALMGAEVEILAYRARGLSHVITEGMTIAAGRTVEASSTASAPFGSLDEALARAAGRGLVCNPSSLHLRSRARRRSQPAAPC